MAQPSSSAQQLQEALGARLRAIRIDALLTARDLGRLMGRHSSKISRIEHGHITPSTADIQAWCEHCGASGQVADLVASMRAIEGMWTEWRQMERTGLRHAQETVLPLYERTHRFRVYSSWLLPGLLQTRAYTGAALRGAMRRRGIPDDIEDAVAVRMDRQRLLHAGDRRYAFLIEESVLRAGIGGVEVMAGQLGHLISVSSMPNVSLGVVPMRPDRSIRPVEDFWIFDDVQVNVELVSGYLTVTQPRELTMYVKAFSELAKLAAYGAAAWSLITAAIDALGSEPDEPRPYAPGPEDGHERPR